ncbi:FecCD family ABC transporter permease [Thermodesulfatator atlanticus]|uniref:FecCD family ABC transporter permease n=1 Tax=Thermodesulfatator atlanticus TaxID=501497 RepID=UPI0003B71548|nr:iron ABC transporter permease [Thermodesulfatator atlanticus]
MREGSLFILLMVLLLLSLALGLRFGAVELAWPLKGVARKIFWEVRVPRVLLAALVGVSLSVSGLFFQYVMQNPLADAFTTGAAASSALGAVLALFVGAAALMLPAALLAALLGLLVVFRVASIRGRLLPVSMILAGIVVSTFSSAAISFLKFLSEDAVASIVFWLMGGFQNASWEKVAILEGVVLVSLLLIWPRSLALDLMAFDDETARTSGLNIDRLRKELLFLGALLTAVSVSFAGIIGFVGLIVPHVLRLLGLYQAKKLLVFSCLLGAVFMINTDLLSRVVLAGGEELPVGVFTSLLGGVFFLYLLLKRKRELYVLD